MSRFSALPIAARRIGLRILTAGLIGLAGLIMLMVALQPGQTTAHGQAGGLQLDMLGPDTTLAGQTITYTLLVTNSSGQTLQNVVITDVWTNQIYNGNYAASGLSVLTATFVPSGSQPYVRWNLGALSSAVGGSIVMTTYVDLSLQPSTTKNIVGTPIILGNVAIITTTTSGVSGQNDSVNPLVVGPAMYLEKTFAPASVRPGRLVTFSLFLTNRPTSQRVDSIAATNVVITEVIPLKTLFWSAGGPATIDYSDTARLVTWHLSDPLPPGQSVTVTLTLRISPTLKNANDVNTIVNTRGSFSFRSTEVTILRLGEQDVRLVGNDVVEKSVQVGPPPPIQPSPPNPPKTFPNRIITYTIAVYNPLTGTLSGFLITDTLPQYPYPGGPYFIYSDTLAVAPYTAPTLVLTSGRVAVWTLPDIQAWGVYSFALRVRVPPSADTNGRIGRDYDNKVEGKLPVSSTVVYDNQTPPEARVTVVPQIITYKTVAPNQVFSGYPVTYTLWLTNVGNTLITNIGLTDTLPAGFVFAEMVQGPAPVITTPMITWAPISLTPYTDYKIQFRAIAYGFPSIRWTDYCNIVSGYSPDTFIPTHNGAVVANTPGCVWILNPFTLNKFATPSPIVLGDSFQYRIVIGNVSNDDYDIEQIRDYLPDNIEYNSGALYVTNYPTPVSLPAGGTIEEQFTVVARTVPRNICNQLPTNIYQTTGKVQFDVLNGSTWSNYAYIGPVYVYPHVALAKYSQLPGAAPGELITYTVLLTNYTSLARTNMVVSDVLPFGFQYARMLPGSTITPAQVLPGANPQIIWTGLTVPPDGATSFTFVVTASLGTGDNKENAVMAYSAIDPDVCVPALGTSLGGKAGPRVNVRNKWVTYAKTASPTSVGPLGLVDYGVNITNKGPYLVSDVLITDVLPTSVIGPPPFRFYSSSPLPAGVTQVSTDPPAWRITSLRPDTGVVIHFKARATVYPAANYLNTVIGLPGSGWIITPATALNSNFAPVTIVPGAALDKIVEPGVAITGSTVIYTITLYNQSGSILAGLRITDVLPSGFAYDGMITTQYLPDTVSPVLMWNSKLPAVNNNTRLVLAFRARISATLASGTYYNRVSASAPNIIIPNTDDTAPVQVQGAPNVATSKIVEPSITYRGGSVVYTITLVNESANPLTVRVTDTLPALFTFGAALPGTPSPDSTSPLVWNSVALAANETRPLAFQVDVSPSALTGTFSNTVNVSGQGLNFAGSGPTAPVTVKSEPTYDLLVTKDGTPHLVQVGDLITYTINYQNNSSDGVTLANVALTDSLPLNATAVRGDFTEVSPGVLIANIGSLSPGATGSATLVVSVDSQPGDNTLLNMVFIGGDAPANAIETDSTNNADFEATFVGSPPDISIDKSVTPTLAFVDDWVTYTLPLFNNSAVTVTVRLTDTMPTGFVFDSAIGSPAPDTTLPLMWSSLSLPPGQGLTLMWRAQVSAAALLGFFYNSVDWDVNDIALPSHNDLAQIEVDLRRFYALSITKDDGQSRAQGGQILTYTIRYTNTSSNVTLTQVSLTDSFSPAGVITFLTGGWSLAAAGVYTQAEPDLLPGASQALTVQLQLAPTLPADLLSISNTVNLDGVPTSVRATELITSQRSSTDIDIVNGADIVVLSMGYAPTQLRQGGTLIVTVVLQNQGVISTTGPDGTGWFGADVYVKPANAPAPTGPADRYLGLCLNASNNPCTTQFDHYQVAKFYTTVPGLGGLAPSEIFTLTYTLLLRDSGQHWLYAQADPFWGGGSDPDPVYGSSLSGRIVEGNEANNIFGPIAIYVNPNVYLPIVLRNY
jgi:uncharacterized repeat protein (TIGR01451 family)